MIPKIERFNYPLIIKDVLPRNKFFTLVGELHSGWELSNRSDSKRYGTYKCFWGMSDENINRIPFFDASTVINLKIQKYLKLPLRFIKYHINGQIFGQSGNFHKDFDEDGIWTFILFCSSHWETNWGGEFVCYNPVTKEYKYVPYIPNSGCLIPSNWDHYGSSPNDQTGLLRTSVAFSFCDCKILPDFINNNKQYKKFL